MSTLITTTPTIVNAVAAQTKTAAKGPVSESSAFPAIAEVETGQNPPAVFTKSVQDTSERYQATREAGDRTVTRSYERQAERSAPDESKNSSVPESGPKLRERPEGVKAESGLPTTQVARSVAEHSRYQILTQARSAVLAQGNISPGKITSLLG